MLYTLCINSNRFLKSSQCGADKVQGVARSDDRVGSMARRSDDRAGTVIPISISIKGVLWRSIEIEMAEKPQETELQKTEWISFMDGQHF